MCLAILLSSTLITGVNPSLKWTASYSLAKRSDAVECWPILNCASELVAFGGMAHHVHKVGKLLIIHSNGNFLSSTSHTRCFGISRIEDEEKAKDEEQAAEKPRNKLLKRVKRKPRK